MNHIENNMRNMRRFTLTGLLIAVISLLSITCATNKYATVKENGKTYYLYTVQKSEGIYGISKRFGVTQAEIIDANPDVADGLQLGQQIRIPVTSANSQYIEEYQKENSAVKNTQTKATDSGRLHKVKSKETLYSISNKYGVTVDDILELNPWAYNLTVGSLVKIPSQRAIVNTAAEPATTATPAVEMTSAAEEIKPEATETETIEEMPRSSKNSIIIAILMPFETDSVNRDANLDHFVDFYKGCLLAADSLRKSGLNITIDAYDIGKSATKLTSTLKQARLKNADIIFGPAYSSQITYVATYAKNNKIKLVVPFTSNIAGISDNPYLFQVVTPQKELFDIAAEKCVEQWADKRVLIVTPDTLGIIYDKKEFVNKLLPQLSQNHIEYKMVPEKMLSNTVNKDIEDKGGNVVVILPTTKKTKLIQLGEEVAQFNNANGNISILGFPEWDALQIKELYSVPMYTFTNYSVNMDTPEIKRLYQLYIEKFGMPYHQTKPSFTLVGFDVFHYFATQLQQNGDHFEQYLEQDKEMLQMVFNFKKIPFGGYVNKGIYMLEYTNNGIEKLY